MKIYENQLVYLIDSCNRTARMRGFSDTLLMPLEWRPQTGLGLLQEYANGDATLAPGTHQMTLDRFINAYGGYLDEENNLRHSAIAARALQKSGR